MNKILTDIVVRKAMRIWGKYRVAKIISIKNLAKFNGVWYDIKGVMC